MSIRIVLADDHKIVRDGLRKLLDQEVGIEVVGEADTGRKTTEMVRELSPDVIVMDITMPDLTGIEATRKIKKEVPATKVLCLFMHADKRFVMAVIRAGASGRTRNPGTGIDFYHFCKEFSTQYQHHYFSGGRRRIQNPLVIGN